MLVKVCLTFDMEARVEESAAGLHELGSYLLYDGPLFPLRHPAVKASLAFFHYMTGDCDFNCRIVPAPIPVTTVPIDNDASGITYHFRPRHISSIGAPPRHHMLSIDLLYFTGHQV